MILEKLMILILFLPSVLCAQDWPQLLGPNRNGVYSGPGRVPGAQLWKKPVGQGFSAPVVAGGKLIVFQRVDDKEVVDAWNPSTGARLWSYSYRSNYRDDFGFDEGPRAAPLVDGSLVFTFGAEGQLHCVNLADGKRIWSEDTMKRFQVRKGFFGAACSPVVSGDLILLNIGGPGAGIVAFHKDTGKVAWTATSDEASYSAPLVARVGGLPRALFFTRAGFVDLDPVNGRVHFQMPWRSRSQASVNAATPVAAGEIVFLSASYGTGAIALEMKGTAYRKLWSSDDVLSNHYSTSVFHNGHLYGFHGRQEEGQELRAVELRSGKVLWSAPGLRAGTVTLAGDVLLVLRENGELIRVNASPKSFQLLGRHALLGGTVRAYPALADGRLYLRNEDTLAAYELK
jgi:outer membrane protein assembly factor BamB